MPRYDYRCPSCDVRFEVQRSFGATDDVLCPSCATPAKKVFTPAAVVFKGSGFHNTDYRPKPAPETAASTTSASSSPSTSSGDTSASSSAQ